MASAPGTDQRYHYRRPYVVIYAYGNALALGGIGCMLGASAPWFAVSGVVGLLAINDWWLLKAWRVAGVRIADEGVGTRSAVREHVIPWANIAGVHSEGKRVFVDLANGRQPELLGVRQGKPNHSTRGPTVLDVVGTFQAHLAARQQASRRGPLPE